MVAGVEVPIDTSANAEAMAEAIFGDSVQVVSATYTGDPDSSGIYDDTNNDAPGVVPGPTGVILSTGDTSAFTNNNASQSNLNTGTTTGSSGPNNVQDFNDASNVLAPAASLK
ncbi:MAG: choice-of-anchor L domain-containing protein, partial [Pseudomonadota bacterium]